MLCTPAASADVVHAAVRVFPVPASATAVQPASGVPASLNATVPVGAVPVTLAVSVTLWPAVDGLVPLASVVVDVVCAAPTDTCTVSALDDADCTAITMLCVLSVYELPTTSAPSVKAPVAGVMSRNCVSS